MLERSSSPYRFHQSYFWLLCVVLTPSDERLVMVSECLSFCCTSGSRDIAVSTASSCTVCATCRGTLEGEVFQHCCRRSLVLSPIQIWCVLDWATEAIITRIRRVKVERRGFAVQVSRSRDGWWVNPSRFSGRNSRVRGVLPVISLCTRELFGGETTRPWSHAAGWDLRQCLADKPVLVVLARTRNLVFNDLSQCAVIVTNVMPCRKDLNIDDGQNAVVNIVMVNFASNSLLANMMDLAIHFFMYNSWDIGVSHKTV